MAENTAAVLKQTSQNNAINIGTRENKLSSLKSVYSNSRRADKMSQDLLQFIHETDTDPTTHFPS
jgi:hypothetical protein